MCPLADAVLLRVSDTIMKGSLASHPRAAYQPVSTVAADKLAPTPNIIGYTYDELRKRVCNPTYGIISFIRYRPNASDSWNVVRRYLPWSANTLGLSIEDRRQNDDTIDSNLMKSTAFVNAFINKTRPKQAGYTFQNDRLHAEITRMILSRVLQWYDTAPRNYQLQNYFGALPNNFLEEVCDKAMIEGIATFLEKHTNLESNKKLQLHNIARSMATEGVDTRTAWSQINRIIQGSTTVQGGDDPSNTIHGGDGMIHYVDDKSIGSVLYHHIIRNYATAHAEGRIPYDPDNSPNPLGVLRSPVILSYPLATYSYLGTPAGGTISDNEFYNKWQEHERFTYFQEILGNIEDVASSMVHLCSSLEKEIQSENTYMDLFDNYAEIQAQKEIKKFAPLSLMTFYGAPTKHAQKIYNLDSTSASDEYGLQHAAKDLIFRKDISQILNNKYFESPLEILEAYNSSGSGSSISKESYMGFIKRVVQLTRFNYSMM